MSQLIQSLIFYLKKSCLCQEKQRIVPITQCIKNPPAIQDTEETWVQFLVKKIPWIRKQQPIPVFLPGKSHGQRRLAGYTQKFSKNQTQLSDEAQHRDKQKNRGLKSRTKKYTNNSSITDIFLVDFQSFLFLTKKLFALEKLY